jgi:hypothetical protein
MLIEEWLNMRRIWILLRAMIILVSLTACGEDNGQAGASISAPETVGTENIQERSVSDSTGSTAESAANISEAKSVQETEMNEAGGMETDIQNDGEENAVMNMKVQVGDTIFSATLEENAAVSALVDMMRESPVVLQMSDYSGFEKVGPLGTSLPVDNSQTTTHAGDIVLYNGNQIVIFYGSNSWSYTRLGHIDDLTGWEEALGNGDVTVTFYLK